MDRHAYAIVWHSCRGNCNRLSGNFNRDLRSLDGATRRRIGLAPVSQTNKNPATS